MSNYRYQIENYHSIGKADIAINGITVLTGVNGAGKSTLARWLYYIINIASSYETNRFEEFCKTLTVIIEQFAKTKNEFSITEDDGEVSYRKAIRKISHAEYSGVDSADNILQIYTVVVRQFCLDLKEAVPKMNASSLTRILNFLNVEKQIGEDDDKWTSQFYADMIRVGEKARELFLLTIKNRPVNMFFEKSKRTYRETDRPDTISFQEDGVDIITTNRIGTLLGLNSSIYIDTPMALSINDSTNLFWNELLFMLKNQDENIEISREAKKMLKRIKLITGGEVVEKKDVFGQKELFYTRKADGLTIKLENAATGIKTFAYIEQLLRKGYLTNRTILIIDEPEAHLHPQWIVEFARLLVLLTKEIGLKIMLASHDPDMVSAIRYVAEAEGALDRTNFYLAEQDENAETYTYKYLGTDIESIFESFNMALTKIELYGSNSVH